MGTSAPAVLRRSYDGPEQEADSEDSMNQAARSSMLALSRKHPDEQEPQRRAYPLVEFGAAPQVAAAGHGDDACDDDDEASQVTAVGCAVVVRSLMMFAFSKSSFCAAAVGKQDGHRGPGQSVQVSSRPPRNAQRPVGAARRLGKMLAATALQFRPPAETNCSRSQSSGPGDGQHLYLNPDF